MYSPCYKSMKRKNELETSTSIAFSIRATDTDIVKAR